MPFGKLTTISLCEAARDRLMRIIAAGESRPGRRLNEVHLAESLDVSRGPIREAARELEGQGFLVSRVNQGVFVADFTADEIRDIYEAKDWMEAAFVSDLDADLDEATRRAILAEIDGIDASDRFAFNLSLVRFRVRAAARLRNRFLADLMLTLYRKFHILWAIVRTPEASARQARALGVLRRFWTAIGGARRRHRPRGPTRRHRLLARGPAAPIRGGGVKRAVRRTPLRSLFGLGARELIP